MHLADTYMNLGREKEAHAEAAEVLRINPKFSLEEYKKLNANSPGADKYINSLRKAGLK